MIGPKESFRFMFSNTYLKSHETLPLMDAKESKIEKV